MKSSSFKFWWAETNPNHLKGSKQKGDLLYRPKDQVSFDCLIVEQKSQSDSFWQVWRFSPETEDSQSLAVIVWGYRFSCTIALQNLWKHLVSCCKVWITIIFVHPWFLKYWSWLLPCNIIIIIIIMLIIIIIITFWHPTFQISKKNVVSTAELTRFPLKQSWI